MPKRTAAPYTRDDVKTWTRTAREDRERDPAAYARMLAEIRAQAAARWPND